MNEIEFIRRMVAQAKKMLVDKFDEGCRINRDPGDEFLLQWPFKNGQEFDALWKKSLCKTCIACGECGFKSAHNCEFYKFDDKLVEGLKTHAQIDITIYGTTKAPPPVFDT